MGLFTSPCKNCGEPYHWFLVSHGFTCRECGTKHTAMELEDSWNKEYQRHIDSSKRDRTPDEMFEDYLKWKKIDR